MNTHYLFSIMAILIPMISFSQEKNVRLPEPDRTGGIPLMKAMQERSSTRTFSTDPIELQQLSNLCWAAWGINRSEAGKRTVPSSHNFQEMDLYVVLRDAVYVYDAINNQLDICAEGDLRQYCGTQDFVAMAPVNFMYVANLQKRGLKLPEEINDGSLLSSWANAGFMAQNVYLSCASQGLGTVIRAMIDRDLFHKELKLSPMQRVILGQTIGIPGK